MATKGRSVSSKAPKAKREGRRVEESPEGRRLTSRQAAYLAAESGIAAEELARLTVGELPDKLRWRIDPRHFFFQKVCGRVVKRDPVTGELRPVPYATVHVEDTDCNFLFYGPPGYPYVWLWPWACSREEIATVQTDECGNFCVWIPRWDIDRLLRWRRERICFPTLEPPRLIDVLEDLLPDPGPIGPRPPLPDPPPDFMNVELARETEARLGPELARRLATATPSASLGAYRGGLDEVLREPAPKSALPRPPLPDDAELRARVKDAGALGKGVEGIAQIDLRGLLGPFRICRDVFIPEWQTIVDVPDITFRVTQDQPGGEVTIYSEGYFDVRWDETSVPDVTLEASAAALAVDVCDGPAVACTNVPAILNVDEMPLTAGYHDDTSGDLTFGHGIRVNQRSADGISPLSPGPLAGNAHAPYADRLDLYGCFHIAGATHYRVMASLEGATAQPVLAGSFPVLTTGFVVDYQHQLPGGWYEIRNDLVSSYEHFILGWLPAGNGTWEVTLEVGAMSGGSINPVGSPSQPHTFEVDATTPVATYHQIRWWYEDLGPGTATTLTDLLCPIINRSTGHPAVILEITWSASAAHLRSAALSMHSCKDGALVDPIAGNTRWWWQTPTGNSTGIKVATFRIPSGYHAGCYTASILAVSRAYNPAVPGASLSDDWFVHEARRRVQPAKSISVVDV